MRIVQCVNAHDGLVEALRETRTVLRDCRDNMPAGNTWHRAANAEMVIDAAVAKATGAPQ